ncbi:MAG: arginase family protein [Acidobacteria bacterium]|nr:arginase family protein [Acidobacteriota bacterium]MCA1639917.1 arginase family protein [Acidobacteriota bacterium]
MGCRFIIAPYDAATRIGGTSRAAHIWRELVPKEQQVFYDRFLSPIIPSIVEFEAENACRQGHIPFLLGGDHSLTYYLVKGAVSFYGPITIVHFDAHHDHYPQAQINHFTVFYHIEKRLPVKIIPVGHRYEIATPVPVELTSIITGPTYISVDVDYFSPNLVSSVSHPVSCDSTQGRCDLLSFKRSLDKIEGLIVGLDLVEWMGARKTSEEFSFIESVFSLLCDKCNRK